MALHRAATLAFAAALLPACGGGGGGDSEPPPPPPPAFSESFDGPFPGTAWIVEQANGAGAIDPASGSPAPSLNLTGTGGIFEAATAQVFKTYTYIAVSFAARAGTGTMRLELETASGTWLHAYADIDPATVSLGQLYKAPRVLPNDGAWHTYKFEAQKYIPNGGFRRWWRDGVLVWEDAEETQTDFSVVIRLSANDGATGHFDSIIVENP